MSKGLRVSLLLCLILLLLAGCSSRVPLSFPQANTPPRVDTIEQPVTVIPLKGPLSRRKAQLSGLVWYGDNLILLPQYPNRFENNLFYLTKEEIISLLRGDTHEPLRPRPIPLVMDELLTRIPGFQGFEAIAFDGERAFLTVEAKADDQMIGYLVAGDLESDLSELRLTPDLISSIAPQTNLNNVSDEAILLEGDQIVTIYEVNGSLANLSPIAHVFSTDGLQLVSTIPFPLIDYRITDTTNLDEADRFWAINSFTLPGYPLRLGMEALAVKYGVGPTHQVSHVVERLVQFQYSSTGITLVDIPPVQLQLLDDTARNWEGIVRLESVEFSGFLLVTDRQPATILAFVPYAFE